MSETPEEEKRGFKLHYLSSVDGTKPMTEEKKRVFKFVSTIIRSDDETFHALLPSIDLDARGQMRWTPLMWAVHKNREKYVTAMLRSENAPRRRVRDKQKCGVLHLATTRRIYSLKTILELIQYNEAHGQCLFGINDADKNGSTVLHGAAKRGHHDILTLIFESYDILQRGDALTDDLLLHSAIADTKTKTEVDSHSTELQSAKGMLPTVSSATAEVRSAEDCLMQQQPCEVPTDVETKEEMHASADASVIDTKKSVCEFASVLDLDEIQERDKADHSDDDVKQSEEEIAESGEEADKGCAVASALSGGKKKKKKTAAVFQMPDPNAHECDSKSGCTPLHLAVEKGHRDAVRVLLALRLCAVNAEDNRGRTPLMVAIAEDYLGIAKQLLACDYDTCDLDALDSMNFSWNTAMWAVYRRRAEGLKLILDSKLPFHWWHVSELDESVFDMFASSKFFGTDAEKMLSRLRKRASTALLPQLLAVPFLKDALFPDPLAAVIISFAY